MDEGIVEGGEDACDAKDELACKLSISKMNTAFGAGVMCRPSLT
jgi:hypothetical protein